MWTLTHSSQSFSFKYDNKRLVGTATNANIFLTHRRLWYNLLASVLRFRFLSGNLFPVKAARSFVCPFLSLYQRVSDNSFWLLNSAITKRKLQINSAGSVLRWKQPKFWWTSLYSTNTSTSTSVIYSRYKAKVISNIIDLIPRKQQ